MSWLQQVFQGIAQLQPMLIVCPWQQAVRVRLGARARLLGPGLHLKLPLVDRVYVQNTRLRLVNLPVQTVTTKDRKTVTLSSIVGFSVSDALQLFQELQHPEDAISNHALAGVARAIATTTAEQLDAEYVGFLENSVRDQLQDLAKSWGVVIKHVRITDLAFVRTYRLIQDTKWSWGSGLQMDKQAQ